MAWGEPLSPYFLLLSTDETEFAEKGEGDERIGAAHRQVASDLLQLAQAGLQLSCYVVCRQEEKNKSPILSSAWVETPKNTFHFVYALHVRLKSFIMS